jgi:hypothetical protein
LERNGKKARAEMVKHVQEVEQDLVALQKERRIKELSLHGVMREKEGIMF